VILVLPQPAFQFIAQQWLQTETNENISITIQKAVESQLNIPCAILRIGKQQNTIKIQHLMSDKDADEVYHSF
jgi:hypothetical protein